MQVLGSLAPRVDPEDPEVVEDVQAGSGSAPQVEPEDTEVVEAVQACSSGAQGDLNASFDIE